VSGRSNARDGILGAIVMVSDQSLWQLLTESGALQEGHFRLVGGLHSPRYFECGLLFRDPRKAERIFDRLAEAFRSDGIDRTVGLEETGSILAFEVARRLECEAMFARRRSEEVVLRSGFRTPPDARVLILDDVTTTGGTVLKLRDRVAAEGGMPAGVALVATKGLVHLDFGCKTVVLAELRDMPTYDPSACPQCRVGDPITNP
jgi:orotate phosphoribosyltransferase